MNNYLKIATLSVVLILTSCLSKTRPIGSIVFDEQIAALKSGVSTKSDVVKLLGTPSIISTFDKNKWYYYTETATETPAFGTKTQSRKIIVIDFDDYNVLTSVSDAQNSGIAIKPDETKTVVPGEKKDFIDKSLDAVNLN